MAQVKQIAQVKIYDTTLRDGAQQEGISFSVSDKLKIVNKLDELGVHFIEGGFPGGNPKDTELFAELKKLSLKNSTLVAFGSTRHPSSKAGQDTNLRSLASSGTKYVCIVGKSWDLQVRHVLEVGLEDNLDIISESIDYLCSKGKTVIFDAEHFFDGFKANPDYAIKVVEMAARAGAECVVLCDTNGGGLPSQIAAAVKVAKKEVKVELGVHAHNDSDLAVANSLAAVQSGVHSGTGHNQWIR